VTDRREPLTLDDRRLLRRRALFVLPVGALIGAAAVWMLGWGAAELPVGVRAAFGVFFGGLLLFIVGVHTGSVFEREKLVRRGVVTGKRVGVIGPTTSSSSSRTSPNYYVSLDGDELMVEQWVFSRVHTGQTVDLLYTARLRNLFDVAVIAEPAPTESPVATVAQYVAVEPPHEEALTTADRGVLRGQLLRAVVRRGIGGLVAGGLVWVVCLLGWVLARPLLADHDALDLLVVNKLGPVLGLLVFVALNRRTGRIVGDLFGGRASVRTEVVRDVIRSNTPLLSPTTVLSGTGLAGNYAWVQTETRWVQCEGGLAGELVSGDPIRIVSAPRSGTVLAVGAFAAPRVGLTVFDWLALALLGGTIWLVVS
jgi:hypothetical protein